MKTTLLATLAALFLLSAAAQGQATAGYAALINSEPQVLQMPSHQLRATQQLLNGEQNILFTAQNPWGKGERPLWEVSKPKPEIPLGDIARALRQQHATAKRAVKVLEQ